MSLGLFKKAWNSIQLEDLKNYFSLDGYLLKLDSNNTVVASRGLANINGNSGVIQFTGAFLASSVNRFAIINTSFTTSSVVFFSLKYFGSTGLPCFAHYNFGQNPQNARLFIFIANKDLAPTDGIVELSFLIVN
jgi:hypothetical protein